MSSRLRPLAVLAAALLAVLGLPSVTAAASEPSVGPADVAGTVVYGIDDENIIWEIDPVVGTFTQVNDTQLPGVSNSMAYDTERDQFFFINRGPDFAPDNRLLFWDRFGTGSGSTPVVATQAQLGLPPQSTQPANATYYDDAYWFIPQGTRTLHKVAFTYVDNIPQNPALTTYDLAQYAGTPYPGGNYGDIVISGGGMLYGAHSTGRFYSIDTNLLDDPTSEPYTEIVPDGTNPSLQLSFDATYTTLFAHDFFDGEWYTIDTSTGELTPLEFITRIPGTENGFRDLGGASFSSAPAACEIVTETDNQSAPVGTAVAENPALLVTTVTGDPVPDVEVEFAVATGGGNLDGESTATVTTDAEGVATAPAWVLGDDEGENTLTATVGTLCEETFTAEATPPPAPAITLVKALSGEAPRVAGDEVVWVLTATNTGNVTLSDVRVTDPFISEGGLLECEQPIVPLEPGESLICLGLYAATQGNIDAGFLTNTATATGTDPSGTVVDDTDSVTVDIVQSPAVGITKTLTDHEDANANGVVDSGDRLKWRVVATNTGNVTLSDMDVTDDLTGDRVLCPVVAPTQTCGMTTSYTVTDSDAGRAEITNTAVVTATGPRGEQLTAEASSVVPVSAPEPTVPPQENPAATTLPQTGGIAALGAGLILLLAGGALLLARRVLGNRGLAAH